MTADTSHVGDTASPEEPADELRLWADHYEAASRALDMVRAGEISGELLQKILAGDRRSADAIDRIRDIWGSV